MQFEERHPDLPRLAVEGIEGVDVTNTLLHYESSYVDYRGSFEHVRVESLHACVQLVT